MKIPRSTSRSAPSRLLALLPATALAAGLLAGCSDGGASDAGSTASASASVDPTEQVAESLSKFSYPGEDGRTALELLEQHDPDAQVQGKGENAYVTAIGGREADPETEFWGLYVDDEMAQVGAGSLETKDGETITWKLEEIEK
ncbi:DUF4430 domain-containing protein [Krasilnikoviella flava]|uniref:Transcobalamin-like C-terminal domain-containing protein n=1 Tax=Krasilnikoviella flava TaxID=526729 RepID=A0A1T5LB06_9MICO|nr:DUF4430 domain-containing protein [Krasilnikoviella flava]SKC72865.1 protein of unknown function [Krasilnikoviella flava]